MPPPAAVVVAAGVDKELLAPLPLVAHHVQLLGLPFAAVVVGVEPEMRVQPPVIVRVESEFLAQVQLHSRNMKMPKMPVEALAF